LHATGSGLTFTAGKLADSSPESSDDDDDDDVHTHAMLAEPEKT